MTRIQQVLIKVTNIVNNNGVFTMVPSTNNAHAGEFTMRVKASDGVHITSVPITVSLVFHQQLHLEIFISHIHQEQLEKSLVVPMKQMRQVLILSSQVQRMLVI